MPTELPSHSEVSQPRRSRTVGVTILLLLLLAALAALRLCVGNSQLGWPAQADVAQIRWLRLGAAVLVGIALSTSGVGLQALLRNPLAEPFILGLSSGAAVGVMLQMTLEHKLGLPLSADAPGALIGALASAGLVYAASRRRGMLDPLGLLLTGVVLSMVNGAIIMLLNALSVGPAGMKENLSRWMMGYLREEDLTAQRIVVGAVIVLTGSGILWALGRAMDVASFGDAEAQSLGVNLKLLRRLLFVVASILAACAVVLAGPIAFVGLICPHLARLVLGPGHRNLLIGSALLGAALVTLADTTSVILDMSFGVGLMPIGVFTAVIGGPVFLWMLHPQLGRGVE